MSYPFLNEDDRTTTDRHVVNAALDLLSRGEVLTIDAVARATGLTKPGVLHHIGSKRNLMLRAVDEVVDRWTIELRRYPSQMGPDAEGAPFRATATTRLRSYLDFACAHAFDASDLALFADPRLRERLREQWAQRLRPWLGPPAGERSPAQVAVRLLADGMWFNAALGTGAATAQEKEQVRVLGHQLLDSESADAAEDSEGASTP